MNRILGFMKHILAISLCLTLLNLLPLRAFGVSELVMFEADYCTWCDMWHEEIGGIYHLTAESCQAPLKRTDFTNGDLPKSISIIEPVIYTPTFVLTYQNQEVGRITGYPGQDFFWADLNDIIKKGLPEDLRQTNSQNCKQS